MKIIFSIWLIVLPLVLNAQVSINQEKSLYRNKVITYTKMKNAGIAMTLGGAALSVAGIVMMSNSGYDPYNYYTTDEAYDKWLTGYLIAVVGIGATGGGITLWAIGSSKIKKYTQKLNYISLNLNPAPRQLVSLSIRF